jgi:hypothetical protein
VLQVMALSAERQTRNAPMGAHASQGHNHELCGTLMLAHYRIAQLARSFLRMHHKQLSQSASALCMPAALLLLLCMLCTMDTAACLAEV